MTAIIAGDFNTPLSKMDRSSKQDINKDTVALNKALDEIDLTDIYRESLSSQRSKIHILFRCTWNIFKDELQIIYVRSGDMMPVPTSWVLF